MKISQKKTEKEEKILEENAQERKMERMNWKLLVIKYLPTVVSLGIALSCLSQWAVLQPRTF